MADPTSAAGSRWQTLRFLAIVTGAWWWLAALSPATAAPLAITNASFEENASVLVPNVGNWTNGGVPGWTVAGGGLFRPDTPLNFAPDGSVVLYLGGGGTARQALKHADGSAVTATPGLPVTVSMSGRGRFGAAETVNLTIETTTGATVSSPHALALPANTTGYTSVSTTLVLPDSLGANAGQALQLALSNPGAQVNLDAVAVSTSLPVSIDSFTATPSVVQPGQNVTLAWSVSNATSVTLDGTPVAAAGSLVITPAASAVHVLTANGAISSVSRELGVVVRPLGPRINEIMASNTRTLQDEDGAWSDWIEIHNPASTAIDLGGMFLTDNRALKTKWSFPAGVILAPGGHLVVFASSKDRRVAGSHLHTNFSLDKAGEYLALVAADGTTVLSAFSPAFPTLSTDVSYGLGVGHLLSDTNLVAAGSAARYLVPAAPVASDWRGGGTYDDSTWSTGPFDFGFTGSGPDQTSYTAPSGTIGNQAYGGSLGMDFIVHSPVTVTAVGCFDSEGDGISGTGTNIRTQIFTRSDGGTPDDPADDTGGTGLLASPVSFTSASPGTLAGAHRFKSLSQPLVLAPGAYTLVSWGHNSANPNGNNAAGFCSVHDGGGLLVFTGRSRYGSAGAFPGYVDHHVSQYGAGSFVYHGTGGHFATDTGAAMQGINASLLTRLSFQHDAATSYPSLSLHVTADDGYVAWLNGTEIARHNAPAEPAHHSTATAAGEVTHQVTVPASLLIHGTNILAIQGLNITATDPDFHLDASLSAQTGISGMVHFRTPTPGAPNSIGSFAGHVVINEIHCDPPDSKSRFVEFVELHNPLPDPVDLGGWSFTKGVTYRFPAGTVIPAGGFLVIAEDPAHLQQFLGCSGALGPWTGSLANDGEEITLADPTGLVVDHVNYESGFPWPTVGDDPATSMQRLNAGLDADLGASWRSAPPTPGTANSTTAFDTPPAIRQVAHLPLAPLSGQTVTVTAKVTDPDGLHSVTLEYQDVAPGAYIRLTDPEWQSSWTSVPMRDDGTDGDILADDDIHTAVIPAALQQHRHLIRYRIAARDSLLNHVRVPYADDPSANFAWFCHDGVPAWTGARQPGSTTADAFDEATMRKVRPWHLLSRESDVLACQYAGIDDGIYRHEGALVIDGHVYDHLRYRVKGQNSTFVVGKNKWKFKFNRGNYLALPDDRGLTTSTVRTLNLSSLAEPWAPWNRGLAGLDEAVAFKLYQLAGVATPATSFVHWRVIDHAAESDPADQYNGDLWGLYLAFPNYDNLFKESRGMPDGNLFQLQGGQNELTGQGRGQATDFSDLSAFLAGYQAAGQTEAWFRSHVNLHAYASWRAITEAVNNTDRREQENMVYFRNPDDGRWSIHPWDSDLLYEQLDRWGPQGTQSSAPYEGIQNCLKHSPIRIEWQNRCRELQDLLLNSDQAWKVMDETVCLVAREIPRLIPADPALPGYSVDSGFIEVDRRMWDWHPRSNSKGIFYQNPFAIPDMGYGPPQPFYRTLATADFAGMLKWVKDFVAGDAHGGGRLAALAAGTVNPLTLATGETPAAIPLTPTISHAGPSGFPSNALVLQSSAFQAGGGTGFAAMEWRIGEISDPSTQGFDPSKPWVYEISSVWNSPVLTGFQSTITPSAANLATGKTYRARVRHKNLAGHWSHWSTPLQFVAGAALPGNLATDLVISEIMYDPPEGADLEFIELSNISADSPLPLDGLRFTSGIQFTFPSELVLAPQAKLLVVRNRAAFEAKYGTNLTIAGEYPASSLDNGGETLTLSLGLSQILRTVPYDDQAPWPEAAGGSGASLALVAPHLAPDHADPNNWRAGTPTPGGSDAIRYADWKAQSGLGDDADPDGDGMTSFLEYALGGNPTTPDHERLPVFQQLPDGSCSVAFSRAILAEDAGWQVQQSSDLAAWHPVTNSTVISRSTTLTEEQLTLSIPPDPTRRNRFFRLAFFAR